MSWGVWWGLGLERPAWASLPPVLIREQEQRGELPPGTAAQLGGVIVTKRGRGTLRPELVVTSGPQRLAQPGDGTYPELYGSRWALGLYRGGPRLYQARSGVWVDRTDPTALGVLAASGVRHVALAWDQAARPVLAWESGGAVYVRQWSGQLARYVTRGPWAGRDPLLIADATAGAPLADSDALLLYLDGAALVARVQRDGYAVPYTLAAAVPGAVLDQVVTVPASFAALGAGPDGAALAWQSAPYPLRVADAVRPGAALAVRIAGQVVIIRDVSGADAVSLSVALAVQLRAPLAVQLAPDAVRPGAALAVGITDSLSGRDAGRLSTGAALRSTLSILPVRVVSGDAMTPGAALKAVLT